MICAGYEREIERFKMRYSTKHTVDKNLTEWLSGRLRGLERWA